MSHLVLYWALSGADYLCLEQMCIVPKVVEPLKLATYMLIKILADIDYEDRNHIGHISFFFSWRRAS